MAKVAQTIVKPRYLSGVGSRLSDPLVITVILNTNRRDDTLAALESLERNGYTNKRQIVLDNASSDGSFEAIREQFPAVQVLRLEKNLGYAGNNNVGIQAAMSQGADWIFILNEDTVLADDLLQKMIDAGQNDQEIGILGPMVYHYDEPEIIQSAGGRLGPGWQSIHIGQNEPDRGQYIKPVQVDWISGCAILVRREVIEQVGMLDVNFFYYWEETEWCLRARRNGWKIVHVPMAKLWHKGVQKNYMPGPNVTYYNTRNHLLMMSKHHAPISIRLYNYLQILRTVVSWSIIPKWRSRRLHRDAMWQAVMDFFNHRWGMRTFHSGTFEK